MSYQKKYNMNDPRFTSGDQFNLSIRNVNELNDMERRAWNDNARQDAQRVLDGSPMPKSWTAEYRDQVLKWMTDTSAQQMRGRRAWEAQPRDEDSGRYVPRTDGPLMRALEPQEDNTALGRMLSEPSEEEAFLAEFNKWREARGLMPADRLPDAPTRSTTVKPDTPNHIGIPHADAESYEDPAFHWVYRNGAMYQVERQPKKAPTEYAPGTGSIWDNVAKNSPNAGKMNYASPQQINKALGKRGQN